MTKKIYVIFTCDDWKSTNSMCFVGVASTKEQLNRCLIKMAKEDVVKINISNMKITDDISIHDLNTNIENAYIEESELNQFEY